MVCPKRVLCVLCAASTFIVLCSAQDNPNDDTASVGIVIYADGDEFSVYRDGTLHSYQLSYESIIGLPLYRGDMVQTADNTFVEIQLLPASNILKVAENTTFKLSDLQAGGSGAFDVTYGRVRAKVRDLSRNQSFQLRGRTAIAGVRGTDFGYDIVAGADGGVETSVYCLEGSVEVTRKIPVPAEQQPAASAGEQETTDGDAGDDPATKADPGDAVGSDAAGETFEYQEPVIISASEMVSIRHVEEDSDREAETVPAAAEPLASEISRFWQDNDFVETAIPAERIEELFPTLRSRVIEDRGVEPQFLKEPTTSGPTEQRTVEDEVLDRTELATDAGEESEEEERIRRVKIRRKVNRISGWGLTTSGLVVTAGSLALRYYGPEILPNQPPQSRQSISEGMLVYGSILMSTGIISFLMSYF
jgi:hypothetical protein